MDKCHCVTFNFDLWVSKGARDVFALVINFLGSNRKPKQMTIGLFEVTKITGQALVKNFINFLDAYGLKNQIITYVKDQCSNLNTLTSPLKFV